MASQKLCVSLNRGFNPLWLNADITLCNGGGAVLQKALDKGNVKAVGPVDFRSVPFAEAMCADTLNAQIAADKGELLLHSAFRDGEDQIISSDAVPQTVVLNVLRNHERDGEDAPLAGLLLHDLKTVSVPVLHDLARAELHNVADAQAQVSLQHKGRCDALIRAASAEALLHGLYDLLVLLGGERLCLLVHGSLQQ